MGIPVDVSKLPSEVRQKTVRLFPPAYFLNTHPPTRCQCAKIRTSTTNIYLKQILIKKYSNISDNIMANADFLKKF